MLYKPTFKSNIPSSATRKGKRVSWTNREGKKVSAEIRKDAAGNEYVLVQNKCWYARYTDSAGRRVQRSTGCTDKDAAKQVLAGWKMKTEKVKAGVLHASKEHSTKKDVTTIEGALNEYTEVLRRKGRSEKHISHSEHVITQMYEGCRIIRLIDLTRIMCEKYLAKLQDAKLSARTRNHHKAILSGFGAFCVRNGYLESNPAAGIESASVTLDRRHIRRAYTDDEILALLKAASERPLHDARYKIVRTDAKKAPELKKQNIERLTMLGRERRLIYLTLVTTAARWGELRSVCVNDVVVDGEPHIRLQAAGTKNRKADTVPLTKALAKELKSWIRDSGKIGKAKLFNMPENGIRVFERDRIRAGIEKETKDGIADIHALRHTTATRLAKNGVPIATAQRILRHSDPKITMGIYSHLGVMDTHAAVEGLPDFQETKEDETQEGR
mgnify:CR=1 FL=1